MAKESVLQIRIDSDLKEEVETLYKNLGTSFAEAVRIFARQSILEQRMPFEIGVKPETQTIQALSREVENMKETLKELQEQERDRQRLQAKSLKQTKRFYDSVSDSLAVKDLGSGMFEVNGAMVVGAKDTEDAVRMVKSGEAELYEAYSRVIPDEVLEFQSIGLSVRAATCIARAGFHSVAEFLTTTEADFSPEKQIQNLSPKVREEILQKLQSLKTNKS